MIQLKKNTLVVGLLLSTVGLQGCIVKQVLPETYAPPNPVVPEPPPAIAGSIYRAGADVRLFEDLKAHRVGDILTVRLVEQTSATKSSSTSISKDSAAGYENPTVLGRPLTMGGIPLLSSSLSGTQSFDGAGDSAQSNSLQGDISVTVVERFANGNLRIRGEKWVTINQGKEFVRVSGIIRPFDISPDNSIASTKVANARIAYSGKGALAAANRMGLLQKFLNSVLHPF
ncbi:MAG: flagellar basal body L-ring protein FlgH [Pseudomonadota bacterium]